MPDPTITPAMREKLDFVRNRFPNYRETLKAISREEVHFSWGCHWRRTLEIEHDQVVSHLYGDFTLLGTKSLTYYLTPAGLAALEDEG